MALFYCVLKQPFHAAFQAVCYSAVSNSGLTELVGVDEVVELLGGTGTFFGPVLGAGIVTSLQQYLSGAVGDWVTAIIGAIFVACVLLFRRGIIGEVLAWQQRRQAGRAAAQEPVGRA